MYAFESKNSDFKELGILKKSLVIFDKVSVHRTDQSVWELSAHFRVRTLRAAAFSFCAVLRAAFFSLCR